MCSLDSTAPSAAYPSPREQGHGSEGGIVCFLFGRNMCKAEVIHALKELGVGWEADLGLRGSVAMLYAHPMPLPPLPDG